MEGSKGGSWDASDYIPVFDQKNEIHTSKEIKITNPKYFLRDLRNSINELGYGIQKESESEIEKIDLEKIGHISASIKGIKTYVEKRHRNRSLSIGIILSIIGVLILFFDILVGLLLFGIGELIIAMAIFRRIISTNSI